MKEIKISFSITLLLDRCDVNHVEEELLKKREEVFKGIMVRVLDEIEKERLRQEVRCPACEGEVIKKGSEVRKIETLIGGIRYRRARFKCKECGGEFYPLDNALGLEPQRKCTLGVIARAFQKKRVDYSRDCLFSRIQKRHPFLPRLQENVRASSHCVQREEPPYLKLCSSVGKIPFSTSSL